MSRTSKELPLTFLQSKKVIISICYSLHLGARRFSLYNAQLVFASNGRQKMCPSTKRCGLCTKVCAYTSARVK